MATLVDMGGDTLIVNDIQLGAASPGTTGVSINTSEAYVRYTITGVNFNSATTDNPIVLSLPPGTSTYKVQSVSVWGASHTLTTATMSLWTAAGGTGVAICADQALTNTSGTANTALNEQDLTLASATTAFTSGTVYARVGTAEGAAATGNVTVVIRILG